MEKICNIDNSIYNTLGERWYTAEDDPVALLRAENRLKSPWIANELKTQGFKPSPEVKILDIGCGGGFLSNYCAKLGYSITGLDISKESLDIARRYDTSGTVSYIEGDCYALPFENETFSIVTSMDFLEHIPDPKRAILEASRVLKPGGLFFFHTFNRNPLSYLLVIKCVEWLVKNTPRDMHVYNLFIKPKELHNYCQEAGMKPEKITGIKPVLLNKAFWKGLWTGCVADDFAFEETSSTLLSYMGYARKPHCNITYSSLQNYPS
jgi:2-polyprenyl-6-hydroxyphenyl methylase/3-demethylubiquinone-9 3-methyltransferase